MCPPCSKRCNCAAKYMPVTCISFRCCRAAGLLYVLLPRSKADSHSVKEDGTFAAVSGCMKVRINVWCLSARFCVVMNHDAIAQMCGTH